MPQGKGTYGSKVGRPKKNGASKKKATKKVASKKMPAKDLAGFQKKQKK